MLRVDYILISTIILILSLAIDLMFGEPPKFIHPVVWIGKYIEFIDSKIKRKSKYIELFSGILLCLTTILIFTVTITTLISIIRYLLGVIPWVLATAITLKTMYAVRDMENHVNPIVKFLEEGDLVSAREKLKLIVDRRVDNLDKEHILSAAIESIAENLVDSVISPLFYFGFLGIMGAIIYRTVNILDAIVGYRNRKYIYVGHPSAKLDDILNWIPARLSVILILISAKLLNLHVKNGIATISERNKVESPNSGYPIATISGVLNVKLEKINYYSIGWWKLPSKVEVVINALKIFKIASTIMVILTIFLYCVIGLKIQFTIENLFLNLLLNAMHYK